jgi:hypothetical protein
MSVPDHRTYGPNHSDGPAPETVRRWLLAAGVALLALLLGYIMWSNTTNSGLSSDRDKQRAGKTSAQASLSAVAPIASEGKAIAAQIETECKADATFRADHPQLCPRASQLATATPTLPPRPVVHEIVSTAIVGGHLMVTYRNPAQTVDLGRVTGSKGLRGKTGASGKPAPTITPSPGQSGANGRGITGALVTTDGHLILSFTDDTTQDVGVVVGPAGADGKDGVSFKSAAIVDGHLIVTRSDGTTQDAGELPVGPPCPAGYSQATVTPRPVESPGETWVVCASN